MENQNVQQAEALGRQLFRIKRLQEKSAAVGAKVVLAITNAKGCSILVSEAQLREVLGPAFDPIVAAAKEQLDIQLAMARGLIEIDINLL